MKGTATYGLVFAVSAQVEDPSKYGVVVTDDTGKVDRFVEKPKARDPTACLRPFMTLSLQNHGLFKSNQATCWVPLLSFRTDPAYLTGNLACCGLLLMHDFGAHANVSHAWYYGQNMRLLQTGSHVCLMALPVVAGQAHLRQDHHRLPP